MPKENANGAIAAAKINATQAIAVALITVFGGIVGVLIGKTSGKNSDQKQAWLTLHRIEAESDAIVRVEVSVNQVVYAYPSKGIWTEVGPDMASQSFPLPIDSSSLNVSFQARITHPGLQNVEEAISQKVQRVKTSKLPAELVYDLYLMTDSGTQAKRRLRIFYSISAE